MQADKRDELVRLFDDFRLDYLETEAGRKHATYYAEGRRQAKENYQTIVTASLRGQNVTDMVLLKLLPYNDTSANRQSGAWVHVAPSITGNLKGWFESKGWTKPDDWPKVAEILLRFVTRCNGNPLDLQSACSEFAASPYAKGFQTGMLTPILNALRPDDYTVVNSKSRWLVNHFAGASFGQKLTDYPGTNRALRELIAEIPRVVSWVSSRTMRPGDLADMFGHWLVAVKKYSTEGVDSDSMTEVQTIQPPKSVLAEPFSRIFQDWEQAQWAFDLLGETFERLEISTPDDRRIATTLPNGQSVFRFDLSVWMVLDFYMKRDGLEVVMLLLADEADALGYSRPGKRFPLRRQKPEVGWYHFPYTALHPMGDKLRAVYEKSFDYFADLFRNLKGSPNHLHSVTQITKAVFDRSWRDQLLRNGLISEPRQSDRPQKERHFTREAFTLLGRLAKKPTRDFRAAHRHEMIELIEKPLYQLLTDVALKLPESFQSTLETRKGIIEPFGEGQVGRMGCFYPKGSEPQDAAFFYVTLMDEGLDFGFTTGEHGQASLERLLKNAQSQQDAISSFLGDWFIQQHKWVDSTGGLIGSSLSWTPDSPPYPTIGYSMGSKRVLDMTKEELSSRIALDLVRLGPLMQLAVADGPLVINTPTVEPSPQPSRNSIYPLPTLAADTGYAVAELETWLAALERKKQAILYGPPGTGKTYMAERLAKHLIGGGDGFMELVQFHPAYAYEDFIQGLRPQRTAEGALTYEMVPGRFLEFCDNARACTGTCVLIIDEINRANLARVFGELMYLLEYRGATVPLAGGNTFSIPANVRILGTMNTADRSIALVDHALRRRFAFIELQPKYEVLTVFHQRENTGYDPAGLIGVLRDLNARINDPFYAVGITFFMHKNLREQIESIWQMEIEPYLEEFFYGQRDGDLADFRWDKVRGKILS